MRLVVISSTRRVKNLQKVPQICDFTAENAAENPPLPRGICRGILNSWPHFSKGTAKWNTCKVQEGLHLVELDSPVGSNSNDKNNTSVTSSRTITSLTISSEFLHSRSSSTPHNKNAQHTRKTSSLVLKKDRKTV